MEVTLMESISKFYKTMKMPNTVSRNVTGVALVSALILLLPLLAMQFTGEVVWSPLDFVVAWTLLFGAGLTYKLVAGKMNNVAYRAAVGISVATALFLVWSNLAVGLIGSEDNHANWMYIGVLAIGIIGAFIAHFKSRGMARTLLATALAQALVAVIVLIAGLGYPENSPLQILILNGFFIVLWVGSALLFQYASREYPSSSLT